MDQPEIDLSGFEARLRGLRPAAIGLDRDRLLFEAGRASAKSSIGRTLAAGFAIVAVGLGGLLVRERGERRALEVALASRPEPSTIAPLPGLEPLDRSVSPESYLALTRRIAVGDLDLSAASALDRPWPGRLPDPSVSPLRVRGPGNRLDL